MSKKILIEVFTFSELSAKAKERAKEKYFSEVVGLSDYLTELTRDVLKEAKYTVTKCEVLYSLGYSQGDGVAFNLIVTAPDGERHKVEHANSHYTHSHTMRYETIAHGTQCNTPDAFIEFVRSLSRTIEKAGYAYIEDEQSDDTVTETCDANEYFFTADGSLSPREVQP